MLLHFSENIVTLKMCSLYIKPSIILRVIVNPAKWHCAIKINIINIYFIEQIVHWYSSLIIAFEAYQLTTYHFSDVTIHNRCAFLYPIYCTTIIKKNLDHASFSLLNRILLPMTQYIINFMTVLYHITGWAKFIGIFNGRAFSLLETGLSSISFVRRDRKSILI